MATNQNRSAVYIDQRERLVHYYAAGAEPVHEIHRYQAPLFDISFFSELITVLQDFKQRHAPSQPLETTFILPDSAVMTDVLSLPAMGRHAQQKSLETTLDGLLKNRKELRVQSFCARQNKQFTELCVSGIREDVLGSLRAAAATAKLASPAVTFAAACTARGAAELNPKLKDGTYLLLDVKSDHTRLVYVLRGEVISFYTLPFGYDILSSTKLIAEDMLFDHSVAELAVLNARERAKSKSLTMMGEGSVDAAEVDVDQLEEDEEEPEQEQEEDEADIQPTGQPSAVRSENTIKYLPRKTPRKLPKFLLRPHPATPEGYLYENFRIFEKWALCFLAGNERLTRLAAPEAVYLNLPERFSGVLEQVKEEEAENGIPFLPAGIAAPSDLIGEHLEMYGGLFLRPEKGLPLPGGFSRRSGTHNVF